LRQYRIFLSTLQNIWGTTRRDTSVRWALDWNPVNALP